MLTDAVQQRFARKVGQPNANGCMEWIGSRNPEGYGHFTINRKSTVASRTAWILTHGPIPHGLIVCHRCDNPPCCNTAHMFLGTHRDNALDRKVKGRTRNSGMGATHCKRGHEFAGENLFVAKSGKRKCRACQRRNQANYLDRLVSNGATK